MELHIVRHMTTLDEEYYDEPSSDSEEEPMSDSGDRSLPKCGVALSDEEAPVMKKLQ